MYFLLRENMICGLKRAPGLVGHININKEGVFLRRVILYHHTLIQFNIFMCISFFFIMGLRLVVFLKDHVTLKTGIMMLKIQFCHHGNILHFKILLNRKLIVKLLNCKFHNIAVFTVYF